MAMNPEVKQALELLFRECVEQEVHCKRCPYKLFCGSSWFTYRASLNRKEHDNDSRRE